MDIQTIASIILIVLGIFFMLVGSIGILRLPDYYSRTHAVSMSDTIGILFVIGGLIVFEGLTLNSIKLLFIVVFIFLANPIGSHALSRTAYRSGLIPRLSKKQDSGDSK